MPSVAVTLFFILSGYGLYKNNRSVKAGEFCKKRLIRIMVPYWLLTLGIFLIMCIQIHKRALFYGITLTNTLLWITGMSGYAYSVFGIPVHLFSAGEWFLGVLIILYILFPLFSALLSRFDHLFLLVATLIFLFWLSNPLYVNFGSDILFNSYPFILGMYLKKHSDSWKLTGYDRSVHKMPDPVILICLLIILLSFMFSLPVEPYAFSQLSIILDAVSIMLIVCRLEPFWRRHPEFSHAAAVCAGLEYEMFLAHHNAIYQAQFMTERIFPVYNTSAFIFMTIMSILLTVLMGWLVCRAEKLTAGIYRKIKHNNKKAAAR